MLRVEYIGIRSQKGSLFQRLEKACVKAGHGIKGDLLNEDPGRQVSIYIRRAGETFSENTDTGFCITRFKPNLIFESTDTLDINAKDTLNAGTCELEITVAGKNCHPLCPLFGKDKTCDIHRNIYFAKVIKNGEIALLDEVLIKRKFKV